jgi:hypothetical protein
VLVFPGEAKSGAARDQDPDVGSGAEQVGDEWGGLEDVLVIVQHEQQAPFTQECLEAGDQRFRARVVHAKDVSDCRRHQMRIHDRGEIDKPHAIREVLGKPRGHGQSEPGLADTTGAGQGQQPDIWLPQAANDRGNLVLPAEDGCGRERERRRMGSGGAIVHGRAHR